MKQPRPLAKPTSLSLLLPSVLYNLCYISGDIAAEAEAAASAAAADCIACLLAQADRPTIRIRK